MLGYVYLHVLHLIDAGIDRACSFFHRIYLNTSVMYFLNQTRVCAIGNNLQSPRSKRFDNVRRKKSGPVIYFVQIQSVTYNTAPNRSGRVVCVAKILPDSHLLSPSREFINNSPLLEYSTFRNVSPATDNHMSILFGIAHLHILNLLQKLWRKILQVIKIGSMDMKYIRVRGDLDLHPINLYEFMGIFDVFFFEKSA